MSSAEKSGLVGMGGGVILRRCNLLTPNDNHVYKKLANLMIVYCHTISALLKNVKYRIVFYQGNSTTTKWQCTVTSIRKVALVLPELGTGIDLRSSKTHTT